MVIKLLILDVVKAGKPKKPDAMKSLCLMLGPDFITDVLVVETSDHARLKIQLAFNNHFQVQKIVFGLFLSPISLKE